MGEIGLARIDAAGHGERFVQAHVSGMGFASKGVENGDINTGYAFEGFVGNGFTVAEISEALGAVLFEEIAVGSDRTMREGQGSNFKIAEIERAGDFAWVRREIAAPMDFAIEGVAENAAEVGHRGRTGINRQRAPELIAEAAAIIEAHDVIGVRVRENDGVDHADFFAEHLEAEFRRGIDDEFGGAGLDVDGRAQTMIFWVGEEAFGIIPADDRDAGGSAGAEKNEREAAGGAVVGLSFVPGHVASDFLCQSVTHVTKFA